MSTEILFTHAEVLDIREQYVTRIEKLERQNEELELMLRRALNQVRAVGEVVRRSIDDAAVFEAALVKLVDECDIMAEEDVARPRVLAPLPGALPKVIVSDMPKSSPAIAAKAPAVKVPAAQPVPPISHSTARPVRPRSVFMAQSASGPTPIPPVPTTIALRLVDTNGAAEVSDDMVIEESGVTVVAARIAAPTPPVLSSPMPGAPQSALRAMVARAQKAAPARLRPSA